MSEHGPTRDQLEHLFARRLISRRDLIAALAGIGIGASGLELLVGTEPIADVQAAGTGHPLGATSDLHLLLIVMDGFRADYATLAPMHHLRSLIARGMSYDTAWVGHLESETPTGHATIATGVYPRKHGVIGFGWRTSPGSFNFMPTDLRQIRAGALTTTIAGGGVPTISDLIHGRNRKDVTVSMSGEKYYASATMGAGADFVFYGKDFGNTFRPVPINANVPPASSHYTSITGDSSFYTQDHFVSDLAVAMVRSLRPRAMLVNLPDPDIAGHYFGGMIAPHNMTSIIKGTDYAIGRILGEYQRQGLLDKTLIVVTADHGMAGNRHIVPIHPIYDEVRQGTAGSLDEELRISMGSIWLKNPQEDNKLAAALVAKRFSGVEGALYKVASGGGFSFEPDPTTAAALPQSLVEAYRRLADTEASPAGPDVILPYREDTMGLTVKKQEHWGTHGGLSWGVQHIPMILAGPGVRHGVSHFPAKLVDVAPTIERLLGLPIPTGVDGVILADALRTASAAERSSQTAVHDERLADVKALQAHSQAQSRQ